MSDLDIDFQFTVRRYRRWNYDGPEEVHEVVPGQWCVFLPHQCDAWDIAGEASTGGSTQDGESHEDAVALLEAFVSQAQAALDALRAEREHGGAS